MIAPILNTNSRDQKCWDLSSDIRGLSNNDRNGKENRLNISKLLLRLQYSQTSLIWTPKGQNQVSALQRCPYYRGRECMILAFLGPNKLSIIERCPYYRGVCKERLDCTWNCLISCFVEDGNTRQQLSFSLPELWYGPLEFNTKQICQHLMN